MMNYQNISYTNAFNPEENPYNIPERASQIEAWQARLNGTDVILLRQPKAGWDRQQRNLHTVYVSGPYLVDDAARQIYFNGLPMHLPRCEYLILEMLIENPTMFCDRNAIISRLTKGQEQPMSQNCLNKHVQKLRNILGEDHRNDVACQYAYGYRWMLPVEKIYIERPEITGIKDI